MNEMNIGRLLRSATTGYVFGCSVPEPEVPHFGMFVKAPAQRGQSEVVGLIYNIAIEDDLFVRQMAATPNLSETYIQDQRANRQVPIEVSVLCVGYRNGGQYAHALPPQPPITLDWINTCADAEVRDFTQRHDYLQLILDAPDAPADELIVAALQRAVESRPPEDRERYRREAGRELAKLLSRDLPRLQRLLKRLAP
ncbi:MAG: hypothetical protein FJ030_14120 [Chloroflexi bacterium]|nr:hypothetical protein [Chloroflexota bacterium]